VNTYADWQARHPQAAAELGQMLGAMPWPADSRTDDKSEAWAQQRDRMRIAKAGGAAWRNNVGAVPTKCNCGAPIVCPGCGARQRPTRYGLVNDSPQLNAVIKSSDLICAIPRLITAQMVGTTIAQFGAVEDKKPGWVYTGTPHEQAQAAFLALVARLGGYATFSTGELTL
jgi:hypothetical protein